LSGTAQHGLTKSFTPVKTTAASVFRGALAYTLIGGTFAATLITLVFLPVMYAI